MRGGEALCSLRIKAATCVPSYRGWSCSSMVMIVCTQARPQRGGGGKAAGRSGKLQRPGAAAAPRRESTRMLMPSRADGGGLWYVLPLTPSALIIPSFVPWWAQVSRLEALLEAGRLQSAFSEQKLQHNLIEERTRCERLRTMRDDALLQVGGGDGGGRGGRGGGARGARRLVPVHTIFVRPAALRRLGVIIRHARLPVLQV